MEPYVWATLIAGLVASDTTSGPQILVSEPLVSCTIAGAIFGDITTGLMIGSLFQLLCFGYMPLGAARFVDSNMASYLGTVALFTAARFNGFTSEQVMAAVLPAFLISVPIGRAGLWLTTRMRHHNNRLCEHFIARIDTGEFPSVTAWHLLGILRSYMRGAIMALVLVPVGAAVCGAIILLPGSTVHIMSRAVPMIFGTVCAAAAYVYWTRHERKPLALGAMGGILWVIAYSAIV
jgi:mannose/fructose/N-acetylgalactosamine-specific phosphotransferase system component IIC